MSWIETHRGAVPPWQCDTTEHFTIAYYFDRLEEARASLAESLGLPAHSGDATRIEARFVRELRKGAVFHIESAPISLTDGLRLGHRVVDSTTGEVVTWFSEYATTTLSADQAAAIAPRLADWNGPASEPRSDPASTDGAIQAASGRIKRGDLDAAGRLALGAMVHRFSAASTHLSASIGMHPGAEEAKRRGFSTFELILTLSGSLDLDAPYQVRTCIAHLGSSSLRMIHVMTHARTGQEVARMGQYGVSLDLDARRPARWAETVRARAERLLVPAG